MDRVRESVTDDPRLSCRRRSQELGLHRSSVWRILKEDLHLTPYIIPVKQALNNQDVAAREEMCRWLQEQFDLDRQWINHVWFTDEAHFHLDSAVNRKSNVFWGQEKPTFVSQRPLHSPKVTAWAALSSLGIIGPFFFENEHGLAENVNQDNYRKIVKRFITTLKRKRVDMDEQWFQQDGATPHAAIATINMLQDTFQDRLISRRTAVNWAAHSPDLNPLDFFLWGYLKNTIYAERHVTLVELKEAITDGIRQITQDICKAVIAHFVKRVEICSRMEGRHFEHLL